MTKVKICGITNFEDAMASVNSGADYLGFNFVEKSSRYIAPGSAKAIIRELPAGIITVGVFVNETIENVLRKAQETEIDAIQLHGEETPEIAERIYELAGLEVIKAFRVSEGFDPVDVLKYKVDTILLDSYSAAEHGGTGKKFDWNIARRVREIFPKLFLAGGLTMDNVGEAVQSVHPFAVDACSGLESSKGIKDHAKVEAFIRNVQKAI